MAYTPDPAHTRPAGASDDTVAAVGKLGEAVEYLERCRGALFEFHQLSGHVDLLLQDAAQALREAGHQGAADLLWAEAIGRDVIPGHWTFQIVEAYTTGYDAAVRRVEEQIRGDLMAGRRHVLEAEMKQSEQLRSERTST